MAATKSNARLYVGARTSGHSAVNAWGANGASKPGAAWRGPAMPVYLRTSAWTGAGSELTMMSNACRRVACRVSDGASSRIARMDLSHLAIAAVLVRAVAPRPPHSRAARQSSRAWCRPSCARL